MIPFRRCVELYQQGGVPEVKRGVYDTLHGQRINAYQTISKATGLSSRGETVWEQREQWDILCVLDACRADTFRQVVDEDADDIRSVGSGSRGWIDRTFEYPDIDLNRIGYITGNPFSDRLDTGLFGLFEHVPVQMTEYDVETTPPDVMADLAIDAWRRRDEFGIDKLVVHFMQPHTPFRSRPEWFGEFVNTDTWGSSVWDRIRGGDISQDEMQAAYRDNLVWAMDDGVSVLTENCDADMVLTADHANGFGKWGIYGHNLDIPMDTVRRVPWYPATATDTYSREPKTTIGTSGNVSPDEQLSALGYID